MAEHTDEHRIPLLRTEKDPVLVIRPKKWIVWIALIAGIAGLVSGIASYVSGQLVRPVQVQNIVERQTNDSIQTDSMLTRITKVENTIEGIHELIEIIAIDVCLRRANDAFAVARLRCETRLRR